MFIRWLFQAVLRTALLLLNLLLVSSILFMVALSVTDPGAAKEVGQSCISCKQPNIDLTGPCGIGRDGELLLERLRDAVRARTKKPKVEPQINPTQQQNVALARVNYYRDMVGVKPISLNKQMNDAASAHAWYNTRHNVSGHTEICENEGYTGVWPWDRLRRAGYRHFSYATEVCSTRWASQNNLLNIDPIWAVDGWIETVYHRFPLLSPDIYEAGFAASKRENRLTYVMDLANPGFRGEKQVVCYPYDGQANLPLEFTGDETPDPLPGKTYPVGYPVTVSFNGYYSIAIKAAKIVDERNREVDAYVLLPFSDEHIRNNLAIIPKRPMKPGERYRALVEADADSESITLDWAFTTRKSLLIP